MKLRIGEPPILLSDEFPKTEGKGCRSPKSIGGSAVTILASAIYVSKRFLTRIPLKKLRLIAGILLIITATPLIIYSTGLPAPDWLHWITPPLR